MKNSFVLPERFVLVGLELAKKGNIFGVPLTSLSHEELIACAAQGWQAYTNHLNDSTETGGNS